MERQMDKMEDASTSTVNSEDLNELVDNLVNGIVDTTAANIESIQQWKEDEAGDNPEEPTAQERAERHLEKFYTTTTTSSTVLHKTEMVSDASDSSASISHVPLLTPREEAAPETVVLDRRYSPVSCIEPSGAQEVKEEPDTKHVFTDSDLLDLQEEDLTDQTLTTPGVNTETRAEQSGQPVDVGREIFTNMCMGLVGCIAESIIEEVLISSETWFNSPDKAWLKESFKENLKSTRQTQDSQTCEEPVRIPKELEHKIMEKAQAVVEKNKQKLISFANTAAAYYVQAAQEGNAHNPQNIISEAKRSQDAHEYNETVPPDAEKKEGELPLTNGKNKDQEPGGPEEVTAAVEETDRLLL